MGSIMDLSPRARFALMMAGTNLLRSIETTEERRTRQMFYGPDNPKPSEDQIKADAKANFKKTMHKMRGR